ncbi:reverse transcriptase domain, reverse transcriptase zinc-binding domain protein [Tanacetum coccineum]
MLTARDITHSGFGLSDSVSDLIANGNLRPFLVASAWNSLRSRADVVDWFHVIWFPQYIPRHAFYIWLVTKQKLKTQDTLRQWDVSPSTDLNLLRCPLYLRSFWYGSDSPRFDDIFTYIIPTSKRKSVIIQEEGLYYSTDHSSYYIYGLYEVGFLQIQEGVCSVLDAIRSMEDIKLLYGSRGEL